MEDKALRTEEKIKLIGGCNKRILVEYNEKNPVKHRYILEQTPQRTGTTETTMTKKVKSVINCNS